MTPATVLTSATVREALKRELCVERGEVTAGFKPRGRALDGAPYDDDRDPDAPLPEVTP